MAAAPFGTALRQLVQRLGVRPPGAPRDAGLLARFAAERDESAFAELVERHGPMVLGVCRRILRNAHDADDAFQATFLVLAHKAARLDRQRPLGGWLYTVARNLALELQASNARRRDREKEAATVATIEPRDETAWREVSAVLDAELGRLPEKYRVPLVLCHIQGMTHEAAARELGWPAGSMAKRLARGQELLRARLLQRGLALPALALACLVQQNVTAAVSSTTVTQLSSAAALYAAGETTGGLITAQAAALAGTALQGLALTRWQLAALLLFGLGLLGAGAAALHRPATAESGPPPVADRLAAEPEQPDPVDQALRKRLFAPATLDKGLANVELAEVVDFLSQRYDLKIRVDEEAFAAAGVVDVQKQPLSMPRVVLPLGTILRLLLRQIEPLDGRVCTFRIERDVIVIAPAFLEYRPDEQVPRGLAQRLFKPVRCDREPYGMTLAAALGEFGTIYGQRLVLDRAAFKEVGEPDADKYPLAGWGRELPEQPSLLEVLNLIRWQVGGDRWRSYIRVRDGAIEFTAARNDSARAAALKAHEEQVREFWALWGEQNQRDAVPRKPLLLPRAIVDAQDPVTLQDALEFLADRYGLTILVDSNAFAGAGIDKVDDQLVRLPQHRRPLPQEEFLRLLLEQVHRDSYAADCVYRREGYFEVVPRHKQIRAGKPLESRHLDRLWEDLERRPGAAARLAEQTLAEAPRETLPYFREHLKPVAVPDPQQAARIKQLTDDLESEQFAARQKAMAELEKLGEAVGPALRDRLAHDPPLDVTVRIDQLVKKLTARQARTVRGVRVLEAIGSAEARQQLKALAAGAPNVPVTEAAREALKRAP